MYNILRRAAMTNFMTFGVRFCLREDCRYNFSTPTGNTQLGGGSKQLCCCVPGEASDMCFYPKPRWFSTNQATKSRRISKTVSCLGENSLSRPVPVLVEFKYSVI